MKIHYYSDCCKSDFINLVEFFSFMIGLSLAHTLKVTGWLENLNT